MLFNVNCIIGLKDGVNSYQVIQRDGDYLKIVCTDFEQVEQIGYDQEIYNHNSEIWIGKENFHLFELLA